MISNPKDAKSQFRADVRADLKRISPSERLLFSTRAWVLLRQQAVWQNARAVLFYAPRRDELDASLLWPEALSERKIVALPRFDPAAGEYIACQFHHPKESLAPGKFGVLEPSADSRALPLNQLDLVLIPGLAFDLSGRRVGRGHGYYDRLLAKVRAIKCGVAFDQQIRAELPAEPHDVRLDCLLTPTRWWSFGQSPAVK